MSNGLYNRLYNGHAAQVMAEFPDNSIDLIITSPPYWTAVTYENQPSWSSYDRYLDDMQTVWQQCARVLRPNGKLCINTASIAIPKKLIEQHTRHVKNLPVDHEQRIMASTDLLRYSVFIWQKQTSKLMFGSYPYPGNIIENNTIESINVYVKPGKPPRFTEAIKQANKLTSAEWLDLTQQVWFMYPQDIKRMEGHPAPFPKKLPARLLRMYTFGVCDGFDGEVVLDPFCGTGTTCAVARAMGRRWIGIDLCHAYLGLAERAIAAASEPPMLMVGHPKYPTQEQLRTTVTSNRGSDAARKHKRDTYGRQAELVEFDDFVVTG